VREGRIQIAKTRTDNCLKIDLSRPYADMSDDDRDLDNMDLESEDDDMEDDELNEKGAPGSTSSKPMTQAEKRAHHNALERKRRDHIKDSFSSLRDSVPSLNGEKQSSRAQILKKAAEFIQHMRRKNASHQHDIEDLKRQNHILENQKRARVSGNGRPMAIDSLDIKKEDLDDLADIDDTEYQVVTSSSDSTTSSSKSIPTAGGIKKAKIATVTSIKK